MPLKNSGLSGGMLLKNHTLTVRDPETSRRNHRRALQALGICQDRIEGIHLSGEPSRDLLQRRTEINTVGQASIWIACYPSRRLVWQIQLSFDELSNLDADLMIELGFELLDGAVLLV